MVEILNVSPAQRIDWRANALWAQLDPLLPGLTVDILSRCVSTNTELMERIRSTLAARQKALGSETQTSRRTLRREADSRPCLLVAEYQTGGRGRSGRTWVSSPGASLTFSLALPLSPANWLGLSLAVSVALAEALQPVPCASELTLALKWPNDLWLVDSGWLSPAVRHGCVTGRKLGGVLIETLSVGSQRFAVVGVGLNVLPLPRYIAAKLSHVVACLQELDPLANVPAVLARVALPLLQALRRFERDGFEPFAARYAARDLLLDQPVRTTQAELLHGRARGVSSQGELQVETSTGLHSINSGDVSVHMASTA